MTRKPKVHFPARFICYGLIPEGTKITGWGAGAYQAEYMAKFWKPFWFLALFTGFWVLWGTQLAVVDGKKGASTPPFFM